MIHNRKQDLRVIKTRTAIKNVIKEMICEMEISDITVKELAERAQINRKTFYLHYTCIEALFEDLLQDIAESYFIEIDTIPIPMPMKEVNRVFFTHLAKQEQFIEKLLSSPSYSDFVNKLFAMNLKHNRSRYNPYVIYSQDKQNIINTFLVSSSLEMYRQWIKDNKRLSLEEVIELSGALLSHGVESIKRSNG